MRNLPHGFDIYLDKVKTMKKIAQIFVAFAEKLNFNRYRLSVYSATRILCTSENLPELLYVYLISILENRGFLCVFYTFKRKSGSTL